MRPFWLRQALAQESQACAPLMGAQAADVCIVGGGFTGLWAAIQIKQADPERSVILLEADLCGAGASGRNGGCMLTWTTKFLTLRRLFGDTEAVRLVKASEQAVEDIAAFCQAHDIACDLRREGTLLTATTPAQVGSTDVVVQTLAQYGIHSFEKLPLDEVVRRAGSSRHLEGYYSAAAATVHPGLLVRGLRRVALALGVQIHEHSRMVSLTRDPRPVVRTPLGSVTAGQVVLALNVWMARTFPAFSRTIAIVSSDMVVTTPCPERLQRIGFTHGTSVLDSRTFVYYYHTTADGRLMLGKGGNTFAYGGHLRAVYDRASPYRASLQQALAEFFPALADQPIEQSWNGASDRSVTGLPFFGRLEQHPRIHYALGFSGNGIGPSYMAGQILSSLVLGLDNAWTRSGLIQGPRGRFPPEPFRFAGSLLVRAAIRRKERTEDLQYTTNWLVRRLAHLADAAGKADHA